MIANYEEFRQLIIHHSTSNGEKLLPRASAVLRAAICEFVTGNAYTTKQATEVETIKLLAVYSGILKHKDEPKAIVHQLVYEQILNYNARQLSLVKPKRNLDFLKYVGFHHQTASFASESKPQLVLHDHQKKIIDHIVGAEKESTVKLSSAKLFTAKDLLTEVNGVPLVNPDWLLEMTEENKDKFSRQPYELKRLSFEELISKFSNGREKYETNAFFNHCIRIMLGGLSYIEMIEILFQHIDRQDEQINDLIKNQQIVISHETPELKTIFVSGGMKTETGKDRK